MGGPSGEHAHVHAFCLKKAAEYGFEVQIENYPRNVPNMSKNDPRHVPDMSKKDTRHVQNPSQIMSKFNPKTFDMFQNACIWHLRVTRHAPGIKAGSLGYLGRVVPSISYVAQIPQNFMEFLQFLRISLYNFIECHGTN